MKQLRSLLLFSCWVLVLILQPSSVFSQCGGTGDKHSVTNAGVDFLLCFEQNALPEDHFDSNSQIIYLASLDDTAHVEITCRAYPTFKKTFDLLPNQSVTYHISDDESVLILSAEIVDNHAVRVSSNNPIVCYGMNHITATSDAFLALPKSTAGLEYRVMSYYNSAVNEPGDDPNGQFAVAAFSDNTQVTISPSTPTTSGSPAGTPITFKLDSGQCVQIQAQLNVPGLDLTGSIVTSTKPIALYGSHVCSEIPAGFIATGQPSTTCDHLTEAIPPVSTWGQAFITTNFQPRTIGDLLRVLVLNDNTEVKLNGIPWTTLNKNAFRDTIIKESVLIETSGPALVGEYAHTADVDGIGDPFFAVVPPLDQTYNDYTFFVSEDVDAFPDQRLIVVTESTGKGKIKMDGTTLPGAAFYDLPQTSTGSYSIATVQLTPGTHRIVSTNDEAHGFTILIYGFGFYDSYGYTAGALLKPLRSTIPIIKNPSIARGSNTNGREVQFKNILSERIYLDSAVINGGQKNAIRIKENVAYDIQQVEPGETQTLHLIPNDSLSNSDGEIILYTHTAKWVDLEPTDLPFSLRPAASVSKQATQASYVGSVYPNPVKTTASLSFHLSERADVTVTIYDDLGRVIHVMPGEEMMAGDQTITLSNQTLPAGHYVCELRSQKLSITERRPFIVLE